MATLDSRFESSLEEALGDKIEARIEELMRNFVDVVHNNLQSYGRRHGYDVESTIDSVTDIQIDRSQGTVTATVGWQSSQFSRFEFGVEPHKITGDPLSFVWSGPNVPGWVKDDFDQARSSGGQYASGYRVFLPEVDHPGIPESRALRDSLNGLRRLLEA